MKEFVQAWMKQGVFALLFLLIGGYLLWVATPLDPTIRIYDSAGLASEDTEAVIAYARSQRAFDQATVAKLEREGRWTPWSRGHLFVDIEGSPTRIKVMAGFHGGPLYGGGPVFTGVKVLGVWEFQDAGFWMS